MICLKNIKKTYNAGNAKVEALKGIDLQIDRGEFVVVVGKSGCGKSTLLNIIGGMDKATSGEYRFDELLVNTMKDSELAKFRNEKISFIFQAFNLIPELNVLDNVSMPLGYRGFSKSERVKAAEKALMQVGLLEMSHKKPNVLSGGEQQRVAIARALISEGSVILADEPTGNLDEKNSKDVMELIKKFNENGSTIIMVTHDMDLISYGSRVIYIEDGKINKIP